MAGIETTAMSPVNEYLTTTGEITGYLTNRNLIPEAALPHHLFLGPYSSTMRRLYAKARQVFVHSESVRAEGFKLLKKQRADPLWKNPLLREEFREIERDFLQMVTTKAEGERAVLTFMDPHTQKIGTTEIRHGEYTSVPGAFNPIDEIIFLGNLPMMIKHTHPDDVLFSPSDYFPLITKTALYGFGRGIKAHVVLCPNLQVLALATDQTLLLSSDESIRLIEDWNRIVQCEGDEEGKTIASAIEQLSIDYQRRAEEDLDRAAALTQTLIGGIPLSRKELKRLGRKAEKKYTASQNKDRRFKHAIEELENSYAAFSNAKLLEFARMINVALYISTNTVDFYKFSA